VILLSPLDLALAAVLVLLAAALTRWMRVGETRPLLIAALRTVVQLLLIGYVLKAVFGNVHWLWVMLLGLFMLIVAGREVTVRQSRRFTGGWSLAMGSISMFVSAFSVTVLALTVVVDASPWYTPQYAIPLLGMILGNTMNGVALGLDRLTQSASDKQEIIEARLMLGHRAQDAIANIRTDSIRVGMIPIINAMAAAGLVSLPGMMTGQILAGSDPVEAVKYQILVMFLIAAGTIFGTVGAVWSGSRRLFDQRQRLRLDRLKQTS
jgi:putative ABC transport system permease protein